MSNCIEICNVVKRFQETIALDHVSLSFEEGKIHGLIGRNGSGKSVLLKCICGFMIPDEGEIKTYGERISSKAIHDMGIIIEDPGFIGNLSGYRNLKYLASIQRKIGKDQIHKAIELVGLDPFEKKPVKHYSLGMRHRLGIAQAIMEDQRILLLDEPMNGLDRQGVEQIRQVFLNLKKEGKTIILASHYAEDIDILFDTVSTMDGGKVVETTLKSCK